MKQLLSRVACIFLIISCITSLSAQELEFAPVGAEWYYTYNASTISPNHYDFRVMKVVSDTVIEGKTYKHLVGAGSNNYIRKNNQNQVLIYDSANKIEHLLYDFSLKKEQCYYSDWVEPISSTDSICVSEIGNLQIGGINILTQTLEYYGGMLSFDGLTYENIGNSHHFFPQGDFQAVSGLRCYKDPVHGILNFSNAPCDTTYYITSVNELEAKSPIKVQNNAVQILSPIDELFILDTQGKILRRETNLNTGDVVKIPNKTSNISIIKWEVDGHISHIKTPN